MAQLDRSAQLQSYLLIVPQGLLLKNLSPDAISHSCDNDSPASFTLEQQVISLEYKHLLWAFNYKARSQAQGELVYLFENHQWSKKICAAHTQACSKAQFVAPKGE